MFVANDQMALGLLRALAESGRGVPSDVAVVGFDDIADAADYLPPLTTVRQDIAAGARGLVDLLLRRLAGDTTESLVLPPELIGRATA